MTTTTVGAPAAGLRILMLAPTPFFADRGCHVRILEEARALQRRGHQVLVVTYHLGRDLPDIATVRTPRIPWYRKLAAGPSWHKPYLDLLLFFSAWRAARAFRPDILHAHLHEGAFVAAFLKPLLRRPLLFDCQGSLCGELLDHNFFRRGSLLHRLFAALEGWITRRADAIVTSSTATAEALMRDFPAVAERVRALPDAVDVEAFSPAPRSAELARKLGLPAGKTIIAYLGALTTYQGVDLLLEAIARLRRRRSDFHLLLMGYPEVEYRRQVETLGIGEVVTLPGRIDYRRAAEYLALADLAVSPKLSTSEANGKLLNYMACGLPCVAFDNRINRELLGEFGSYARRGDADELLVRLEELLDDGAGRIERGRQLRARVVAVHSWSARIATLESVYADCLT